MGKCFEMLIVYNQHFYRTQFKAFEMIKILFLIGFSAIAALCCGQQKELDSFLNLLKNHPREDLTRLNLLNEVAFDYCEIDPGIGLKTAQKAVALSIKLDNKKYEAKAYRSEGINYIRLGDDSLATIAYNKSLKIFQELHDEKGVAEVLYNLGEIAFNQGYYYKSLNNLERSAEYFKKNDSSFLENIYNSTATIYHSISNYSLALQYFFKALSISEKTGSIETSATILGNIGILYDEINENQKALHYHQKALDLYKKAGNTNGIASELEGIGGIHEKLKDFGEALRYFKKALEIDESIGNKQDVANNLSNISMVYYSMENYSEAFKYFPKAIDLYRELNNKLNFSSLLNNVGDIYANAPDAVLLQNQTDPKQRYFKAIDYNKQAFNLAKQVGSLSNQEKILESLSKIFEKQKDYKNAVEIYKQILPLHDSILNNKKNEEITRQELTYEFNKKDAYSRAEIQRQQTVRNTTLAGAIILLIAAITSFIFYKRRRDAEDQKTKAEFKVQVADVEMKALRSQMNPHFIFNSLQSINKYMLDNDKENASRYLSKFSRLMRLILENSREQEVPLEKDLAALELYLQLESLRFKDSFKYFIEVDPEIDPENTLIPPMLLQPFVENSIIHGLQDKKDGLIKIKVNREDNNINCVVEDNGIGRKKAVVFERGEQHKHESFGIKITQERLRIINQMKKARSAVHILDLKGEDDEPGGLRVELSLPFEQAF